MYEIDRSLKSFRRSVRLAAKRGYDMLKLERTITLLADGGLLPSKYRDHPRDRNARRPVFMKADDCTGAML